MNEKLLNTLLITLIKQTQAKLIEWYEIAGGFELSMPDSSIRIVKHAENSYFLAVYNQEGNTVSETSSSDDESHDLLNLLFNKIKEVNTNEDSILSDIMSRLNSLSSVNIDGIYSVKYSLPGDSGKGIAFLDSGKIYGGDTIFAFFGNYTVEGNNISANITRAQHSVGYPMGGEGNNLVLVALIKDKEITGHAKIAGSHNSLSVSMKKIGDIS